MFPMSISTQPVIGKSNLGGQFFWLQLTLNTHVIIPKISNLRVTPVN